MAFSDGGTLGNPETPSRFYNTQDQKIFVLLNELRRHLEDGRRAVERYHRSRYSPEGELDSERIAEALDSLVSTSQAIRSDIAEIQRQSRPTF